MSLQVLGCSAPLPAKPNRGPVPWRPLHFSKLDGPLGYEAPVTGNPVSVEKETKPQVHVGLSGTVRAAWRGSVPGKLP